MTQPTKTKKQMGVEIKLAFYLTQQIFLLQLGSQQPRELDGGDRGIDTWRTYQKFAFAFTPPLAMDMITEPNK